MAWVKKMRRRGVFFGPAAILLGGAGPGRLRVVAAENVYGDVAAQIGGGGLDVSGILNNPNEDPHLFAASPSVARALAGADVVIVNGADYDPWMAGLLGATNAPGRVVITVAEILGRKPGDNPHLWYDPAAIPALVPHLVAAFAAKDSANAAAYQANGAKFLAALAPLHAQIAALRATYAGIPVTATEPVFGLMAQAIGLQMLNLPFQIAVMNDTEPSPSDVAKFEDDLRGRRVRILFYNRQVTDDLTTRLKAIAQASEVPIIGVTETEPAGLTYLPWMQAGLDAVDKALRTP